MYKRPAVRKSGGSAAPQPPSYLEQVLAPPPPQKKGITAENIEKLKPVFAKALQRRRSKKPPRTYKLSNLTNSLYNAIALIELVDVRKMFQKLETHKDPRITVVSLKGGRFEELGRINEKSLIPFKKGKPNQIGIGFTIDGKKNYVNIFGTGAVRFTGSSDEDKVISFIEEYAGKLEYIEFSNRAGQLMVNKALDLKKFATFLENTTPEKVLYNGRQLTIQLRSSQIVKVEIPAERGRHVNKTSVKLNPVYESVEKMNKLFSITFFPTGIIQYKGRFAGDVGSIIAIIRAALDDAQTHGVFIGEVTERGTKTPKAVTYKTRSSNPPNPPDSFEGECPSGQYCRPNAQGFPTCYTIPVINESSRKTVIEAYKGRVIPESVKALFGIKEHIAGGETKVTLKFEKQDYKGRKVDVLKIGSRQCSRMTEDELVEVARQHQIPGIKKGMGISKMCERIGKSIEKKEVRANFKLDDVEYFVNGEHIRGAVRKNGKPNPGRKCTTLPVETLQKYARAMGIDPTGKTKAAICKAMQEKKVAPHTVIVETPTPQPEAPPISQEKLKKAVEKIKKRKIDLLIEELGLTGGLRDAVEQYSSEGKTLAQVRIYATKLLAIRKRLEKEGAHKHGGPIMEREEL